MTVSSPVSSPARRTTRQRVAINELFDTEDSFLTAQQVHDELVQRGVKVGLATVYRNLQTMGEEGELDAIRAEDGEMAYRRCSPVHHHHLVCRQCGKVVEIGQEETIEDWAREIGSRYGFTETGHELELFGLCAECSGQKA